MIKDLVHADPLPAEQQNGQLTAVQINRLRMDRAELIECLWDLLRDGRVVENDIRRRLGFRLAETVISPHLASPNDEGKAE